MNDKKFFIVLSVITVMILISGIFLVSRAESLSTPTVSNNAKIQIIEPINFDWGKIPINGGVAKKTFTIKNPGSEKLEIFNIKTSCHCTVANIKINNEISQNFGMNGKSNWVGTILPGKSAELNVIFDPSFHGPSGAGPVTRFISIETNSKGNEKVIFTLSGIVIK